MGEKEEERMNETKRKGILCIQLFVSSLPLLNEVRKREPETK